MRLERGGHVENLLPVLNGHHATVGETVAVETAIDLIDDRRVAVTAPQEIRVQRVHHASLDGGGCGAPRLPQHRPAKLLRRANVPALAAEQSALERLELEQLEQVGQTLIHGVLRACAYSS